MTDTAHRLLTSADHRDLRINTDAGAHLGDGVMCALTVPSEFRRVQDEFPILFRFDPATDTFAAFALFGFEAGENLFLVDGDAGQRWDAQYRPLTLAIQPFLIGGAPDGGDARQVHVDTAHPRIASGGEGVRVFDDHGRASPYLEAIADRLGELDAGYRAAGDFFAALRRHDLLEPLSLDITLDDGSTNRLVGWHAIDEERLRALDAAALGELHAEDHLTALYMALASLGRIGELVRRKNAAVAHG